MWDERKASKTTVAFETVDDNEALIFHHRVNSHPWSFHQINRLISNSNKRCIQIDVKHEAMAPYIISTVPQWRHKLRGNLLLLYCDYVFGCVLPRSRDWLSTRHSLLLQFSRIKINFSFSCSPFSKKSISKQGKTKKIYTKIFTHIFSRYLMCLLTVLCLSRITCCRDSISERKELKNIFLANP